MSRTAPALSDLPVKQGFRLRGTEMTRLETFTDAAFAFALLVISLDPPTNLVGLLGALREVPAFVFSGVLLMVFWWGHDQWSRRYGLDDAPTVALSCVLVFTVLVYVIPLRLLGSMFFLWIEQLTGLPVAAHDRAAGLGVHDPARGEPALSSVGESAQARARATLNPRCTRP